MKLDVVEGRLTVALEKYINLAAYSLQGWLKICLNMVYTLEPSHATDIQNYVKRIVMWKIERSQSCCFFVLGSNKSFL